MSQQNWKTFTPNKREGGSTNKTKNKMGVITTGHQKKKKKISREYHEQPLCQQIIQLRKKGHFPKKDTNYWKWPEVEIENLHRAVESKEIELIILNFSLSLSLIHTLPHTHTHTQTQDLTAFSGKFYQTFKKDLIAKFMRASKK